jgi:hypothetical protein
LHDTRGAALSLALFDGRRPVLWWLGVGNVAGYIGHARAGTNAYESLAVREGVVGRSIPALFATSVPLSVGDTLIIVTGGVHWHPGDGPARRESPDAMARRLLNTHATNGDATAIVARYLGPRHLQS